MSYTTTFHDFIRTYDKAFFLFISQTGEQYSYSDAYSMYRRHYDVHFPIGSKIFSGSGGYLNYYRVQPNPKMGSYWTIVTLDNIYSKYSSLDNLNVKIWEDGSDNSVTVYTETNEQTDQVGYCINSLTSMCGYRDEDDVERWLWDFIDRKHTRNPTGVKLDDFCQQFDAVPTVLLNAIDWLNGFEWNDRNNVVVWLSVEYGKFDLHVRDYSVADSNGKDDAQYYIEEIEDYFGDYAEVTFKPYSNGYWQSVPNPSNFSFDNPGFVDIKYKADISQPVTSSKGDNTMKTLIKSDRYQEDVLETYLTPAYSEDRLYDDLYDCQKHNYLVRKYFKEGLRGDDLINAVTDTINEDIADWDCTAWQGLDEEADEFDPQDLYDESIQSSRRITSAYEDSEVVFRATTRGGKYFVEITDTGDSVDRYMIKQDGSVNYADTTREVLADLVKQSGWKEGTFDKIEIDTDNIGEQYLTIMKMINKEFGFLYKSPKGSPEKQYYYDIIRFIAQNIKNGTDLSIEEIIWKAKDALERKGIHSSRQIKSSYPKNAEQNKFNWAYNSSLKGKDDLQPYEYEYIRWYNENENEPWMKELCEKYDFYPLGDTEKAAFGSALREIGEIQSSRKNIRSSQKGFENVKPGTQYDDYHIDTRGMGILDVENIVDAIESRGNQAVLTVNCSDGSAYHTQFTSKDWKEFKESKNNSGAQVTDVWITEVEPTYVRNSRMVRSGKTLNGKQKNDFIKKAMKSQGYSDKEANQMVNQSRKAIKSDRSKIPEYFVSDKLTFDVGTDLGRDIACQTFIIGGDKGDLWCDGGYYDPDDGTVTLTKCYLQTWLKEEYMDDLESMADTIFWDAFSSIGLDVLSGKEW